MLAMKCHKEDPYYMNT